MDEATHDEWKNGGERREWLELALLETLKSVGVESCPSSFKKVKAMLYHGCASCMYCHTPVHAPHTFALRLSSCHELWWCENACSPKNVKSTANG